MGVIIENGAKDHTSEKKEFPKCSKESNDDSKHEKSNTVMTETKPNEINAVKNIQHDDSNVTTDNDNKCPLSITLEKGKPQEANTIGNDIKEGESSITMTHQDTINSVTLPQQSNYDHFQARSHADLENQVTGDSLKTDSSIETKSSVFKLRFDDQHLESIYKMYQLRYKQSGMFYCLEMLMLVNVPGIILSAVYYSSTQQLIHLIVMCIFLLLNVILMILLRTRQIPDHVIIPLLIWFYSVVQVCISLGMRLPTTHLILLSCTGMYHPGYVSTHYSSDSTQLYRYVSSWVCIYSLLIWFYSVVQVCISLGMHLLTTHLVLLSCTGMYQPGYASTYWCNTVEWVCAIAQLYTKISSYYSSGAIQFMGMYTSST